MPKKPAPGQDHLSADLLAWYDKNRRHLPWRAGKGVQPNPYHVWLSEIMLQQTTVGAVKNYFEQFIARWPRVQDLANASLDEVLTQWQGLGYYSRARNLHKCALMLMQEHGGKFPQNAIDLQKLPGIGPYTSGAIAAIAFNQRTPAVDANIERVIARVYALRQPIKTIKPLLYEKTEQLLPHDRPGDFLQALMDLGSAVCTVKKPKCGICPLQKDCRAFALGIQEQLPVKTEKKESPVRYGEVYIVTNRKAQILLQRREDKGMLGGMMEVPGSKWDHKDAQKKKKEVDHPVRASWQKLPGQVRHSFTHFDLHLTVYRASSEKKLFTKAVWADMDRLSNHALPTLFKKVIRHAVKKIS